MSKQPRHAPGRQQTTCAEYNVTMLTTIRRANATHPHALYCFLVVSQLSDQCFILTSGDVVCRFRLFKGVLVTFSENDIREKETTTTKRMKRISSSRIDTTYSIPFVSSNTERTQV